MDDDWPFYLYTYILERCTENRGHVSLQTDGNSETLGGFYCKAIVQYTFQNTNSPEYQPRRIRSKESVHEIVRKCLSSSAQN